VEAKKTSIDHRLAQTQAEFYVTQLENWNWKIAQQI